MIIETSCNKFYRVTEIADADLAHCWYGLQQVRRKGAFVAKAGAKPSLIRKAATRVVER